MNKEHVKGATSLMMDGSSFHLTSPSDNKITV
jgi:hypothetical protein